MALELSEGGGPGPRGHASGMTGTARRGRSGKVGVAAGDCRDGALLTVRNAVEGPDRGGGQCQIRDGEGGGRTVGVGNWAFQFPAPNPGASCFVLPTPCALHAPCLIPCSLPCPHFRDQPIRGGHPRGWGSDAAVPMPRNAPSACSPPGQHCMGHAPLCVLPRCCVALSGCGLCSDEACFGGTSCRTRPAIERLRGGRMDGGGRVEALT